MDKIESYIYGLLVTDGYLRLNTRNRGALMLEISVKDEDIVDKLIEAVPNSKKRSRTRNTNFSSSYTTVIFSNHQKWFRDRMIECGFPTVDKTLNANAPTSDYDEISFWRGVIDGDGSIGITGKGIPFISLVTKSETLKDAYLAFLKKRFGIEKKVSRNKRDNVYNLMLINKKAVRLAKLLYNNDSIHINRKYEKAKFLFDNYSMDD